MPLSSDALTIEELVTGIASAVGCGLIIFTYLFFPNLRKLRYVELIFYVAINDFMASIGMALGPSENGSTECWYQGLSTTGNYLSSVFWTSVITYQVYEVVVNEGKVLTNMRKIHWICWGLPLFLTFIPLSTSTYSNPDDEATWCFVADRSGSPAWSQLFWFIMSFYVWVWLAMLWSAFMLICITLKLRKMDVVPVVIMSTVGKLALYPLIITICWTLNTVANVYTFSTGKTYNELSRSWLIVYNLGVVMATLQGLFNATVFFCVNRIVREHWQALFVDLWVNICCCCGGGNSGDNKLVGGEGDLESGGSANGYANSNASNSTTANSKRSTGGVRNSSLFNNVNGLRMALAIENESDFIGTAFVTRRSEAVRTAAAGGAAGECVDDDGDEEEDNMMDQERAYLQSAESSSAPLSSLMHGLTRTASGWWEAAARASSASVRSSFAFRQSSQHQYDCSSRGSVVGGGSSLRPSLSPHASRLPSAARLDSTASDSASGHSNASIRHTTATASGGAVVELNTVRRVAPDTSDNSEKSETNEAAATSINPILRK